MSVLLVPNRPLPAGERIHRRSEGTEGGFGSDLGLRAEGSEYSCRVLDDTLPFKHFDWTYPF